MSNKKTVLLVGESKRGKTYSLKQLVLAHGNRMCYINTDGKDMLSFKGKNMINKFITPQDPLDVLQGMRAIEEMTDIDYIVVDTVSHWLKAIEQIHVIGSPDSRGAWGKVYQAAIHDLLYFANNISTKTWIFMSHPMDGDIENNKVQVKAFVKGATKSVGIESYFMNVIYANVEPCDDCEMGLKYNFQVRKTKDTTQLSVSTPEDMFPNAFTETNDIMEVLDAIDRYEEEE